MQATIKATNNDNTTIFTANLSYIHAWFSGQVLNTSAFSSLDGVEIVLPLPGSDATLCTSIPASTFYAGKVLLVLYTGCPMKFASVKASGVSGVVIYGCSPLPPSSCYPDLTFSVYLGGVPAMGGDTSVNFPVIYIVHSDGVSLSSFISSNSGAVKTSIIMIGTGSIEPSEKRGLIQMAKNITFQYRPFYYPVSIGWTDSLLLDPSYDPCTSSTPLQAIWCVAGHVVSIFPCTTNIAGPLLDHVDQLPHLGLLILQVNDLTGPIPPSVCSLKSLVFVNAITNSFSSLPSCMNSLTSLSYLWMNGNKLQGLPDSMNDIAHQIQQLWLPGNSISSFPDFSIFTSLYDIDISGNNGIGNIVSFKGLPLKNVNLAANRLTGSMGADFFDQLPSLTSLDVSGNMIQGVLPNFINSTALTSINIATNKLSGTMPISWGALNQLTVLFARNNFITSIAPLASCASLQSVDLSFNLISNSAVGLDVAFLLRNLASGNRLSTLLLDHNNLTGPFALTGSFMYPVNWLTHVSLSHNQITSLPDNFFSASTFPPWSYFDVSYNALSGDFPSDSPLSSMTYFSTVGNPSLSVSTLPNWLMVDNSTFISDLILPYSCPPVVAKTATTIVHTDPGFYQFYGCVCSNGYYGFASNCTLIPSQVTQNEPGTISDASYSDNRFFSGMDTTWTLTPSSSSSSSSSSPVRVISLALTLFSSFNHNNASNTITISLGGDGAAAILSSDSSVTAEASLIVAQITSNTLSAAATTQYVNVLDNGATVNFKSRDNKAVTHFSITSTYRYECPDGYTVSVAAKRCQPVYVMLVQYQIIVYVVSAVISLFIALVTFIIWKHRTSLIVATASVPFCLIILFFLLMMSVGSTFYALQPSSSGSVVCHLRAWFTGSSVIGVLAALLTKTNRIRRIFNSEVSDSKISNKDLAFTVVFMVLCEVFLLICYSCFASVSSSFQSIVNGQVTTVCPSASDNQSSAVWIAVQFAYVAFFLFGGLFIAFQVRKVPSAFNESSHIAHCLEALLTFGFVIVLVQYITESSPPSLVVLRGLGQAFISLILTLAIFGPKLYFILDGRQNDKSMIYTKSMIGPSQSMLGSPTNTTASDRERAVLGKISRSGELGVNVSSSPSSSSSSTSSTPAPRQGDSALWHRLDEVEKHYVSIKLALKLYANRCDARTHESAQFQELAKSLGNPDWLAVPHVSSSSSSLPVVELERKPTPGDLPGGTSGSEPETECSLSVRHIKFESISKKAE